MRSIILLFLFLTIAYTLAEDFTTYIIRFSSSISEDQAKIVKSTVMSAGGKVMGDYDSEFLIASLPFPDAAIIQSLKNISYVGSVDKEN
ncbi:hypothetical protein CU097_008553 [Rhizopus azygosporus]|uniref:Inhibitor I9 domain-containing protein n=1 Tax=Rhizopus azygosporus TaxID=86630 RepID=A0A367JPZ4_RHIAZ|nr:hypothetical protein CU097_008553 [Rhizopus azygosporus]CEG71957.1 hypothetical protein RMATCC62417_07596 [Rhizopus microsporus]